jgi:hypothetical protein
MDNDFRMYSAKQRFNQIGRSAGISGWVLLFVGTLFFVTGCGEDAKPKPENQAPKIVRRTISETPAAKKPMAVVPITDKAVTVKPLSAEKDTSPNLKSALKVLPREDFYTVSPKDSLASIAAKQMVFNDPSKWALLLRFNLDELSYLKSGPKLPKTILRKGTRLKIPVLNRSNQKPAKPWVVNVMSSPIPDLIVVETTRLIRNGFAAYIVAFSHKGKKWMRLRVGFFETRETAIATGEKIKTLLKLKDSWVTQISASEAINDAS